MKKNSQYSKIWKLISKQKAVLAIFFMLILMLFFRDKTTFYTMYNWMDLLRSATVLEIVAFGVTLTILCAGCDLSCGGTLCIGGILAVMIVNAGLPIWLAFAAGIGSGIIVGFINGFLVVHQKTEAFIITLGMGMLLKGVAQELTEAHPLTCKSLEFMQISNQKFFGEVPALVVYMAVLFILFYCLLRFTSFGRNCYAIGGNYDVAKYSGIKVVPIKWTAFVISGAMSALAGILLASRMNTGSSVYGDTTGMTVNCGAVIGGTSFAGGQGGIIESFIGIFVLQLLTNVMNQLGIDGYNQKLLEGVIIVLIIAADCYGRKIKRERV